MKNHRPKDEPVGTDDVSSSERFAAGTRLQRLVQALEGLSDEVAGIRNPSTVGYVMGTTSRVPAGAVRGRHGVTHRGHFGSQRRQPGDLRIHLCNPAGQQLLGRLARALFGVPDRQQVADV
jgi:hypothetical protein